MEVYHTNWTFMPNGIYTFHCVLYSPLARPAWPLMQGSKLPYKVTKTDKKPTTEACGTNCGNYAERFLIEQKTAASPC